MTDESVIESQQIPANKLKAGWELLKLTFAEWTNDNAFELSAALAFYTIFSIAPVLLIAVGVASFFLAPDTATDQIVGEMEKMIGAQGANAVRQVIESSRGFGKGLWAVSVGIVTLIMGATAVFGELQSALNQIWDVKAKPDRGVIMSFIVDRLRSFSIAICVGFLLLVSLVISAVISGLQNYMNNWLPGIPWVWQMANVVSLVLRDRGSFCHDLQIFARRRDLVERRVDRSGGDGAAFYRRKIRDRYLPRKNCDGQCVWSGRFARRPAVLGLLLCADQLFGSGVHAGLRAPVWPRHPAAKTCGSRRP